MIRLFLKAFNASMSQAEVSKLDAMRMRGDYGPTIANPWRITPKKPWLEITPVFQKEEWGPEEPKTVIERSPEMPIPAKQKEEPKKDYMSRLISFNRHEGKPEDQSIAIAANEAGFAKKADDDEESVATDIGDDAETIEKKSNTVYGNTMAKQPFGVSMKKAIKKLNKSLKLLKKSKLTTLTVEEAPELEKALNSRSFHISRPAGEYDPFGVYRSATTTTNRNFSKLYAPEGVAGPVQDTIANVDAAEKLRTQSKLYKACEVHGNSFLADRGCFRCTIAKSYDCKKCGGQMVKTTAGMTVCSRGC